MKKTSWRRDAVRFGRAIIGHLIVIALLCLIIWGCAGDVWVKPMASQQDLVRDRTDCERQIKQRKSGRVWVPNAQAAENQCMASKGWTLGPQI